MTILKVKSLIGFVLMMGFFLYSLTPSSVFASGHGCATREADRDGDGVADKVDAFPDDPSQYKEELKDAPHEGVCGTEPVKLKLYFIPFGAALTHPVTQDSIEKDRVHALWFCSNNDVTGTIQNILNEGDGGGAAAPVADKKTLLSLGGPKARYGLVPDQEQMEPSQDTPNSLDRGASKTEGGESFESDLDKAVEKLKAVIAKAESGNTELDKGDNVEGLTDIAAQSAASPKAQVQLPSAAAGKNINAAAEAGQKNGESAPAEDELEKLFAEDELKASKPAAPPAKPRLPESVPYPPHDLEEEQVVKARSGDSELSESIQSIDTDQIRLKVIVPQTTVSEIVYLVDQAGSGIKNGALFKLSSRQMEALEKMVDSVSGAVDLTLKPYCPDDSEKPEVRDAAPHVI